MEMSLDYDVDISVKVFEVSEVNVRIRPANHIELIDDRIPMATVVECTFSVESSEERGHVGDRNLTRDD